MGIRIHKIMGFGLVDVKTNKEGEITDKRFNKEGILFKNWDEINRLYSKEKFIEHCKRVCGDTPDGRIEHFDLACLIHHREQTEQTWLNYDSIITFDPEFGLSNVVCITPLTAGDWRRYDDIMDYYEEYTRPAYSGNEPRVDVLTVPIYPYSGYINKKTGERAGRDVEQLIYHFRAADMELSQPAESYEDVDNAYKYGNMRDMCLEKLDCSLHWTEKWNVIVPEQIIEYCRFTKMFTDDKTIYSLVPMIYVYWS